MVLVVYHTSLIVCNGPTNSISHISSVQRAHQLYPVFSAPTQRYFDIIWYTGYTGRSITNCRGSNRVLKLDKDFT